MSTKGTKGNSGTASAVPTPANAGVGDAKPKAFDERGPIGKQFTENGALGGAAQTIGGPLDKGGMIGKQFTTDGSIGGSVQSAAGGMRGKSG